MLNTSFADFASKFTRPVSVIPWRIIIEGRRGCSVAYRTQAEGKAVMVSPKLLLGFAALILLSGSALCSDTKASNPPPDGQGRPMSQETRFNVIRMINAETVFVRKPFPVGEKGLVIKNGVITPNDEQLNFMLAQSGPAAKPGDRATTTAVLIKERSISVEINGGPRKKKKWYQPIEVGVGSSGNPVPVSTDTAENARG